jgi:hypothetical protein
VQRQSIGVLAQFIKTQPPETIPENVDVFLSMSDQE